MILEVNDGWVKRVHFLADHKLVEVEKMPVGNFSGGWPYGDPLGIVHHATAGGGNLAGLRSVLADRNVSAHFGIDREGRIAQFVNLNDRAWHACDANSRWYGVEHIAYAKKGMEHTDIQMEVSAALFAGIIEWSAHHHGFHIPVTHQVVGIPKKGIAAHSDGGSSWGNHGDGPLYAKAPHFKKWGPYLDAIRHELALDKQLH